MKFGVLFLLAVVLAASMYETQGLLTTSRKHIHDLRFSRRHTGSQYQRNQQYQHQLNAQIVAQAGPTQSSAINAAAIKAISKLVSTCGIGVWAGRSGLLDQNALSVLSKLIFNLFQPCLLFVNVASTVARLSEGGGAGAALYILPLAAATQILIGFIVGKIVSLIVYRGNRKSEDGKTLLACTTFGNSGPLPLVFTDALFRNHANPALLTNSVAYISMYLLGWSPLFWIFAPGILSDNKPDAEAAPFADRMKLLAKRVFSPPVMGSLFGMLIGATPFARNIIISKDGFFNPVFEAMRTIGTAYLPTVLMVLAGSLGASATSGGGASVESNKEDSKVQALLRKANASTPFALQVLCIYAARFLLMPTVAFTLMTLATKYIPAASRLFSQDPLLLLILLLEACMPSAQNSTVILQLQQKKDAAGRVARVLLAMYVLGIPAMSYWLIRILKVTKLTV